MEQQIQMEAGVEKQFDYIARTLVGTNFDESYLHKIFEKMAAGIKSFEVEPDRPLYFGEDRLDLKVIVGPARNNPGTSVLQAIDATLVKAIEIPRVIIQEEKGNILVNVPSLDERLSHPPTAKTLEPGLHDEFDAIKKKYEYEINRDLLHLLKQAPDIFNRLQAKHDFKVNFTVPPEHHSAQAQLLTDSIIHNRFSSYFNLTPFEIFGMLRHQQPVLKTLVKTRGVDKEAPFNERLYKSWIKLNFDARQADGSYEMKFIDTRKGASMMEALKNYNFLQMNHPVGTRRIMYMLKKGALVDVDNGNPIGEKRIRIGADPGMQMRLKLYTLDGTPIYNHNEYLKQGLRTEVSEVVSLYLTDNSKGNQPRKPNSERPIKTIVVPINKDSSNDRSAGQRQTPKQKHRQRNNQPGNKRNII